MPSDGQSPRPPPSLLPFPGADKLYRNLMRKVQAVTAVIILLLVGCGNDETQNETRGPDQFGNDYEIVTNEEPALPDEPPALVGDTLFAHVAYPGGCADHDFELETEVRSDTARLWLRHDARGDDCEGMISDRLDIRVPENVLDAETIVLLNPNQPEPFVLRWGALPTRADRSGAMPADTAGAEQPDTTGAM